MRHCMVLNWLLDTRYAGQVAISGRADFGSLSTGRSDMRMRLPSSPWHEAQEKSQAPAR